jgi:hypothetical protein
LPDLPTGEERNRVGNMALSNRQFEALRRLAKGSFGCMTKFEFLDEIGHASARKLMKEGFVIGTREQGGTIKITQTGLDAISDRPWTITDDDMLRKLLASGTRQQLIVQKMNRSIGAVQSRIFLFKKSRKPSEPKA